MTVETEREMLKRIRDRAKKHISDIVELGPALNELKRSAEEELIAQGRELRGVAHETRRNLIETINKADEIVQILDNVRQNLDRLLVALEKEGELKELEKEVLTKLNRYLKDWA